VALTPGTKLGAYEIQSPLGTGGMGEVYRAADTKLGRDVALKVLPAEMAHDGERLGRFRREAKVLAQLAHPNIVTIHSVEEIDGVHFLTMQLVDGQPLDRLIPPTIYRHEYASRSPILSGVRWQRHGAASTRHPPTTLAIVPWRPLVLEKKYSGVSSRQRLLEFVAPE